MITLSDSFAHFFSAHSICLQSKENKIWEKKFTRNKIYKFSELKQTNVLQYYNERNLMLQLITSCDDIKLKKKKNWNGNTI